MNDHQTADPRTEAVTAHFQEWHGAAPDAHEIAALLARIDGVKPSLAMTPIITAQMKHGNYIYSDGKLTYLGQAQDHHNP